MRRPDDPTKYVLLLNTGRPEQVAGGDSDIDRLAVAASEETGWRQVEGRRGLKRKSDGERDGGKTRRERKLDPCIFSPGKTRCDSEYEPDSSSRLPLPGTALSLL